MRAIDLTGQTFGKLTAIKEAGRNKYGVMWECFCSCGKISNVRSAHLRQSKIKSCGCRQGRGRRKIKHGHAMSIGKKASPEYYTWLAMMARCNNPKTPHYRLYGGRGISVCERWLSFENFLSDMGRRPGKGYSLDRFPNKDGDYEQGNCRWATINEQNKNTSRNVFIEHDGRSQILEEWATELRADPGNIGKRLKSGQTFEEIFNHYKYHAIRRPKKCKI